MCVRMYLKTISVVLFFLIDIVCIERMKDEHFFALVIFVMLSALKYAKIYFNLCFFLAGYGLGLGNVPLFSL